MISPIGYLPAMKRFKVAGLFESGMYEYDGSLAYINLKDAQKVLHMEGSVTGIEVRVNDIYDARNIAEKIVSESWISLLGQRLDANESQSLFCA